MSKINQTHDPKLKSWVESANLAESHFPIQNLPFGIFSVASDLPRAGVAIDDRILGLSALEEAGWFDGLIGAAKVFNRQRLNGFIANTQPGDLMGSGTIRGSTSDSLGSLWEISRNGKIPFRSATV